MNALAVVPLGRRFVFLVGAHGGIISAMARSVYHHGGNTDLERIV